MAKLLIKFKIYFQRSIIYIQIAQFTVIFAVFAKTYNLPVWSVPIVVVLGISGMIFIGSVDYRKVLKHEQDYLYQQVPQITELIQLVKKLINENTLNRS